MRRKRSSSFPARQRGAVLFVALILLLVLTVLGVTAARMQSGEERMAMNDDNHQLALQSGEAVLRQVEDQLAGGSPQWQFPNLDADTAGGYDLAKEIGANGGTPGGSSVADTLAAFNASSIPYAGPALGNVPVPAPQFIIENFPAVAAGAGDPMCNSQYPMNAACIVNRITVLAQGGDNSANTTVQSIFH
jgi:type IV pilus assembly protein PilX